MLDHAFYGPGGKYVKTDKGKIAYLRVINPQDNKYFDADSQHKSFAKSKHFANVIDTYELFFPKDAHLKDIQFRKIPQDKIVEWNEADGEDYLMTEVVGESENNEADLLDLRGGYEDNTEQMSNTSDGRYILNLAYSCCSTPG